MDDPDAMDVQERADWFGCEWNHPEPDTDQALSFGEQNERLPSNSVSF